MYIHIHIYIYIYICMHTGSAEENEGASCMHTGSAEENEGASRAVASQAAGFLHVCI